ncbi:hypothetical protein ACZ91_57125 [Streptomyces regensis]|nr:hypothetical protein ACZ91_57125 [Streptomyces regensis]
MAAVLEYVDVAVEVLRTDVVEHDVGATRGRGEFGDEVLLAVVHGDVGAELAAAFEPLVRARGDGDRRAEGLADLDGVRADAARPAVHQQNVPFGQSGVHHEVRPHRARHLGKTGGGDQFDLARQRQQLARGHGHLLGVATACQQGAHLVADLPLGDALAELRDRPRTLQAEDLARAGRRRIVAHPLHHVRPVDGRRRDVEEHLAGRGFRIGDLGQFEILWWAWFPEHDRAHTATVCHLADTSRPLLRSAAGLGLRAGGFPTNGP